MVIFWKWFRAKIVAVVSHRIERYDNPFKSFAFLITNHFEYFSNQKNICGWICCVALEIHTTDTDNNVPVYSINGKHQSLGSNRLLWMVLKMWCESNFFYFIKCLHTSNLNWTRSKTIESICLKLRKFIRNPFHALHLITQLMRNTAFNGWLSSFCHSSVTLNVWWCFTWLTMASLKTYHVNVLYIYCPSELRNQQMTN